MGLPRGWSADQVAQLHPDFAAALIPALRDAERDLLRVRFRSGHRPNAEQKLLHDTFQDRLKRWKAGELKTKPLPAAPPSGSAHNYCLADGTPASLACDVQILGENGQPILTGGSIPLEQRPLEWQRWAAIVARHPLLRDGGTFSTPDTVHVELARWDFKTRTLRPAPAPAQPLSPRVDVEPDGALPTPPAAAADATAVRRGRPRPPARP